MIGTSLERNTRSKVDLVLEPMELWSKLNIVRPRRSMPSSIWTTSWTPISEQRWLCARLTFWCSWVEWRITFSPQRSMTLSSQETQRLSTLYLSWWTLLSKTCQPWLETSTLSSTRSMPWRFSITSCVGSTLLTPHTLFTVTSSLKTFL